MVYTCPSAIFEDSTYDTSSAMSHPREKFERLFDSVNEAFARVAEREGLAFDAEDGHVRRSLRIGNGAFKRGVFLELRENALEADTEDPKVMLAYGAWLYPKRHQFPFHYLRKVFYEGRLAGLRDSIEQTLNAAAAELKHITEEIVVHDGILIEDPKSDGGSSLKQLSDNPQY